jgi:hypothetical protein
VPWRVHQNYLKDLLLFRFARVEDPALEFGARKARAERLLDHL